MYMIATVIYGIPLTDEWQQKHGIDVDEIDDFEGLVDFAYSGGGDTPYWFGKVIGNWDEAVPYMRTGSFDFRPDAKIYKEVMDTLPEFKKVIEAQFSKEAADDLLPVGVYHMFGSS